MTDRFKWCLCWVLVLSLHCLLLPLATNAVAAVPVGSSAPQVGSSEAPNLTNPSLSQTLPTTNDSLQLSLLKQKGVDELPGSQDQSLAALVGITEISVLANVDDQFVKSLAGNRAITEEYISQLAETDLSTSVRYGRNFSRDSLAAMARTEQAKAQSGQALGLLLPSVTVRASRGFEKSEPSVVVDDATGELIPSDKHIRTDISLNVSQPLFNLSSFLDWRRRKIKERSREESYRVSDGDAYLATVNAYLSLVASRLQADVARDFEVQLDELLRYIEKRADAGASSISDMARVRARSQATRSSRLELESAHAAAGTEFIRLTNLVPQKVLLPVLEDVGVSKLPESFELAVTTAMSSNPEIAVLAAELRAAKVDKSIAKGLFLPRVDLDYTDTYSLHAGGGPDSQRDKRLMLVMNWNLLSGGKDFKDHAERTARQNELRYLLDDQRRRVVQELSANYSALATTETRIDSGYLELESITVAAEAMSKRMLSGNQSLLDLLDVLNQSYQVRSRLVSLHVLEMNTVAQLVRLTRGTPWAVTEGRPSAAASGKTRQR